MSINSNLRQLRISSGMTQEQVSGKLGVTRQALSSYESGRTRPDIDTLVRLSAIYGTDLDGIIYGQSRVLKSVRTIKSTAIVLCILLTVLTVVSSALLWSANRYYAIPDSAASSEAMVIFASRQRLVSAWETLDEIILSISLFGFGLLLIFMTTGKYTAEMKTRIAYIALLSGCMLAISTVFGITDAVYTLTDYLITPMRVIARMILIFVVSVIIDLVKKRQARQRKDSSIS